MTEPAGPNCPDGGVAIESGLDSNHDGSLEADEVMTTRYVCTPPTPPAPAPTLVRVVTEPPGPNCSCGGVAIDSGVDSNGNGVLDDDEVASVTYSCKACDELQVIATEPPGPHCVSGGFAIETGLDTNGDGILDPAEVSSTTYQCLPGPWTMRLSDDTTGHCAGAGTAVLAGLDRNGNGLLDDSEIISRADICQPADERVSQLVRLDPEPAGNVCAESGWRVLVGFDLDDDGALQDDEADTAVPICNHAGIPSTLRAQPESAGATCDAGGTVLATGVDADGNGVLDDGEVLVQYEACAPVSRSVGTDVIIYGKPELHALLGVTSISGSLTIDAPGLSRVRIPDIETIGGALTCGAGTYNSCEQTLLALPWLGSVGDVTVHGPRLLSLDLARLRTAHDVDIESTPAGFAASLPALTTCDLLGLYFGKVTALDTPVLQACKVELAVGSLAAVTLPALVSGGVNAQQCDDLASVDVPLLHDGDLVIESTQLTTLSAPDFATGVVMVGGNNILETVSLPSFVSSTLVIVASNSRLTTLSAPVLTHADRLDIVNNYQLPDCQVIALWTQLAHPPGTIANNGGPCN